MSKIIDFKTLIQETLEKRVIDIVNELSEDVKYTNYEGDEEGLFKIIENNSSQLTGVLLELERIQLEKSIYELIHVYKRGLMEGTKILEALGYLNLDFVDEDADN